MDYKNQVSEQTWKTIELKVIGKELLWVVIEHKLVAYHTPRKPTFLQKLLYYMAR